MKIAPRDIKSFIQNPKNKHAVLIYGPDTGLVHKYAKDILRTVYQPTDDSFPHVDTDQDKLIKEKNILYEALSSTNLLGDEPPVLVRSATDKMTKIIKEAFSSINSYNYTIICAGDLAARSSLRKLFEADKNLATIACYKLNNTDLGNLIANKFKEYGISISYDVKAYLTQNLGNDTEVTLSEIEKIVTYLGNNKNLTMEEVILLCQGNDEKNLDDLCFAITNHNISQSNVLCEKMLLQNYNHVMIVKSIMRHFIKIHTLMCHLKNERNVDDAVRKMRPPLFYKHKSHIVSSASKLSEKKILTILQFLYKAETDIKREKEKDSLLLRYVTNLSYLCK